MGERFGRRRADRITAVLAVYANTSGRNTTLPIAAARNAVPVSCPQSFSARGKTVTTSSTADQEQKRIPEHRNRQARSPLQGLSADARAWTVNWSVRHG